MKFTDEQLQAVFEGWNAIASKKGRAPKLSELTDYLTRKPVEFAEGEVCRWESSGELNTFDAQDHDIAHRARKLTTTESGAGELVETLRYLQQNAANPIDRVTAGDAITKWETDRGES